MQNKKKKGVNWGSVISGLIFLLVVAGGPIFNLLRRAIGGAVTLPSNLLPWLISGLVLLSILASVVRSISQSNQRRSDTRLPTSVQPPAMSTPPSMAAPPNMAAPLNTSAPRGAFSSATPPTNAPRFDPIVSPQVVVFGVVGLLLLGGAALLLNLL